MTPGTPTDPTGRAGTGTARRRRGSLRWVLLALALMPLVEITVLIMVGRTIGVWWTIGLLIALAVLGAWLARRETSRTYRSLQQSLSSGRMPTDEATDAILVMLGGFLLILPGFVSDVFGLFLVLPFTRPLARRLLQLIVAQQAVAVLGGPLPGQGRAPSGGGRSPGRGQVIEGEVVSETPPPGFRPEEQPRLEP